MKKPKSPLSAAQARKMLRHEKKKKKKYTPRQRRFMGLIASGKKPTRLGQVSKADRSKLRFS